MPDARTARFEADTVAKVVTVNGQRRLEVRLRSAEGESLVVSLPVHEAVALARLICDYEEQTPFARPRGDRKDGLRA